MKKHGPLEQVGASEPEGRAVTRKKELDQEAEVQLP
jgi:hypothetical protein